MENGGDRPTGTDGRRGGKGMLLTHLAQSDAIAWKIAVETVVFMTTVIRL